MTVMRRAARPDLLLHDLSFVGAEVGAMAGVEVAIAGVKLNGTRAGVMPAAESGTAGVVDRPGPACEVGAKGVGVGRGGGWYVRAADVTPARPGAVIRSALVVSMLPAPAE